MWLDNLGGKFKVYAGGPRGHYNPTVGATKRGTIGPRIVYYLKYSFIVQHYLYEEV